MSRLIILLGLCLKSALASSESEETPITRISYLEVDDLIKESSISLRFSQLENRCTSEAEHLAFLLDTDQPGSFQIMTSFRLHKNFDLWAFEESAYEVKRKHLKLSGLVPLEENFRVEIMPGPTTRLSMINNIISPYVDYITYIRAKKGVKPKNLALIYHCSPDQDVPKSLVKRFSHAYFAGIPHESNVTEDRPYERINATKFISADFSKDKSHLTKLKQNLIPGFVYSLWIRSDSYFSELFSAFPSIEFAGHPDKPRYPEKQDEGFFRFDVPSWKQTVASDDANGTVNFTIVHEPELKFTASTSIWWTASVAAIARRNAELLVWLFVAFIIASSHKFMRIVALVLAVRIIPMFETRYFELLILTVLSFCLSNSALVVLSTIFRLFRDKTDPAKRCAISGLASKILPLVIIASCIILRLGGMVIFALAMQLIIFRTVFCDSITPRAQASALLLQLITTTAYTAVRVPDIMAAVQYYISMPFEFEFELIWIWGLIVWNRLMPSTRGKSEHSATLRAILQLGALTFALPNLRLAHLWPGFCVYLTINFAVSLLPDFKTE